MARVVIVLETYDAENAQSVADLMIARHQLGIIDTGYQDYKLPTPEWVIEKLDQVNSEITNRIRADLQRRLKAAQARRSSLRTAEEKRKGLDSEIEELEGMLSK